MGCMAMDVIAALSKVPEAVAVLAALVVCSAAGSAGQLQLGGSRAIAVASWALRSLAHGIQLQPVQTVRQRPPRGLALCLLALLQPLLLLLPGWLLCSGPWAVLPYEAGVGLRVLALSPCGPAWGLAASLAHGSQVDMTGAGPSWLVLAAAALLAPAVHALLFMQWWPQAAAGALLAALIPLWLGDMMRRRWAGLSLRAEPLLHLASSALLAVASAKVLLSSPSLLLGDGDAAPSSSSPSSSTSEFSFSIVGLSPPWLRMCLATTLCHVLAVVGAYVVARACGLAGSAALRAALHVGGRGGGAESLGLARLLHGNRVMAAPAVASAVVGPAVSCAVALAWRRLVAGETVTLRCMWHALSDYVAEGGNTRAAAAAGGAGGFRPLASGRVPASASCLQQQQHLVTPSPFASGPSLAADGVLFGQADGSGQAAEASGVRPAGAPPPSWGGQAPTATADRTDLPSGGGGFDGAGSSSLPWHHHHHHQQQQQQQQRSVYGSRLSSPFTKPGARTPFAAWDTSDSSSGASPFELPPTQATGGGGQFVPTRSMPFGAPSSDAGSGQWPGGARTSGSLHPDSGQWRGVARTSNSTNPQQQQQQRWVEVDKQHGSGGLVHGDGQGGGTGSAPAAGATATGIAAGASRGGESSSAPAASASATTAAAGASQGDPPAAAAAAAPAGKHLTKAPSDPLPSAGQPLAHTGDLDGVCGGSGPPTAEGGCPTVASVASPPQAPQRPTAAAPEAGAGREPAALRFRTPFAALD